MSDFTNRDLVEGLRAAADFYETHPDYPLPIIAVRGVVYATGNPLDEVVELVREVGGGDLGEQHGMAQITHQFGPGVTLTITAFPEQVGTVREVDKRVTEWTPAPALVDALDGPTVEAVAS